jgi:hypothetical protein
MIEKTKLSKREQNPIVASQSENGHPDFSHQCVGPAQWYAFAMYLLRSTGVAGLRG